MTTPIQQKIRDKKRTPQQILDMVKSGDWIQPGSVGGDSTECMKELAKRIGPKLKDIEIWCYGNFFPQPKFPVSMLPVEGKTRRYPSYDERRNYKMPFNSEIWGFDWDQGYQSGK